MRILRAGPGETIQDRGRFGYLRNGIVESGPMDWIAYDIANRALHNSPSAAAIEISRGGIEIACEDEPICVAFAGGGFVWERGGARLPSAAVVRLRPGERLAAKDGAWGTWTYLAVEGGIDVPPVLGSRSTYARFNIGGFEGRALRAGDVLRTFDTDSATIREGAILSPLLSRPARRVRVVPGPQDDYFTREAVETFFSTPYKISPRFDRMGYWLDGPALKHAGGFDIVSDGIALGGIQVPGTGQPVVLLADHQSTGGYPKLGTLARADIPAFVQRRPGETVHFERCDA
ncbi:MAG: biotin-dependent carboxyltransferase family protein, partial [Vulcanimicrobiaceae bacterium]